MIESRRVSKRVNLCGWQSIMLVCLWKRSFYILKLRGLHRWVTDALVWPRGCMQACTLTEGRPEVGCNSQACVGRS